MAYKLYRRICDLKTLYQAWSVVRTKSSVPGVDRISLNEFERKLTKHLAELQKFMIAQTYVPEPTRRVYIPKDGGEKRKLSVLAIKDKVVQQAVRMVVEPLFESQFMKSSFGYRPHKGPQKAVLRVKQILKEGTEWVAKADIDDFFDSINHSLLLKFITERIWEKPILRLIELWLKIGVIDKTEWLELKEGIPQGGVISPLLSNIYLHPFDKEMKRKGHNLVRYADDFVFVEKTKSIAQEAINYGKSFLRQHLSLNTESVEIRGMQNGFVFLGFFFQKDKLSIAPEKTQKMKEKIGEIVKRTTQFESMIFQLNHAIRGWKNYYGIGESDAQFRFLEDVIFQEISNRLNNNTELNRVEVKEKLKALDFFIPKIPSAQDRFINLLLCKTSTESRIKGKKKSISVSKAVLAKRRKYEQLLGSEANLIINQPGSFLGKTSKRVVIKKMRRRIKEIPIYRLKNILITSNGVSISSDLVRFCCQNEVSIIFLNEFGHPYGYVFASKVPMHILSLLQTEALKQRKGILLARAFVEGKVRNQINLLKYYNKYKRRKEGSFKKDVSQALEKMKLLLKGLDELPKDEKFINRLFAVEGQAASIYWGLIKALLAHDVFFEGRERRGASDLVNSLLNYGYGILYSQVYKAIILAGLNPNIGFLHKGRSDRPALLYDLVEEFRQPVVDKAVIGLIRKKTKLNMQGVYLDKPTKEKLINAVIKALNSRVYYRKAKIKLGEVIHKQSKRLTMFLEGLEDYRPFLFY